MLNKKEKLRIKFILFLFIIAFIIISYRLFSIIVKYNKPVDRGYQTLILDKKNNDVENLRKYIQKRKIVVNPFRGNILDRNNIKLATTIEINNLVIFPEQIENLDKIALDLAKIFDIQYIDVIKKIRTLSKTVVLIEDLTQEQYKLLRKLLKPELESGVLQVRKEYKRVYPYGRLACHLLGFTSKDNIGLEGIEYKYDSILSGKKLKNKIFKSPIGLFFLDKKILTSFSNNSITLTIDKYVQDIVESELDKVYKKYKPTTASVIVMQPTTGEILALSNRPNYDPNNFQAFKSFDRRNFAVTDWYEPGSTIKIITASILLKEQLINPEMEVVCRGSIKKYDHYISCYHKIRHGREHLRQVIKNSCNVGMVEFIDKIKRKIFYHNLMLFGFGMEPGVKLPGENGGLLKKPKYWSGLTKYSIAIGQEIAVTPLQMANCLSVIANDGTLMRPKIIKSIKNFTTKKVAENETKKIRDVIKKSTANYMTDLMVNVVDHGTGRRAKIDGFKIAGKTGTAQIADQKTNKYSVNKVVSSFFGFLPADNPQISILVVINNPTPPDAGGVAAAPVFKHLARRILDYLEIFSEKDISTTIVSLKAKKRHQDIDDSNSYTERIFEPESSSEKKNSFIMPELKGKSLRSVLKQLSEYDLDIETSGNGYVIAQNIRPGSEIRRGGKIKLKLSTERP